MLEFFALSFNDVQEVCYTLAVWLGLIMFSLVPFMYFFIGRQFDKLFKHKRDEWGIFHPGIIFFNQIAHYTVYAGCIVFYKRIQNPKARVTFNFNRFFDGYDFYKKANKFQVFLSYTYFITVFFVLIFGAIGIFPHWISQKIDWLKNLNY